MLKEFKAFIMTGNVVDLAVAVLLAGAAGLVVSGFVADIMMPIVGHFTGGMDFSELKITLSAAVPEVVAEDGTVTVAGVAENAIMYGKWINALINLVIVGFVLFMIVKAMNKMKKKKEEAPAAAPAPSNEEVLLGEIRDLLKNR